MAEKIKVDQMAAEIADILAEYKNGVQNITEEAVRETTNKARADVRARSPRSGDRPASKSYAQHWRTYFEFKGNVRKGIVYNTKAALTHLLEYGHAIKRGGRTVGDSPADVHIAPAADEAAATFEKLLKEGLT